MSGMLDQSVGRTVDCARRRDVMLAPAPAGLGLVLGQEALLTRALEVLLETAVKFSKAGETVRLAGRPLDGNTTRLTIESRGNVIPADSLSSFFDVLTLSEASTPGGDLGLGPAVAHRVLSLFGGSVSVENRAYPGIRLTIDFRSAENAANVVMVDEAASVEMNFVRESGRRIVNSPPPPPERGVVLAG